MGQVIAESKKTTEAPAYFTLDMRASYQMNDNLSLYAGVSNLLDYTQAGDEDTPLFFDADGGFDVGYIYAPLRGREIYAGLKMEF